MSYDIKVAKMTTDYIDLSKQLRDLVKEAAGKIKDSKERKTIEDNLDRILLKKTKSRKRNGKERNYLELIQKRFDISGVVYIQRSDDGYTIYWKSFDFSPFTIQELKQEGYDDAEAQIDLELAGL
jgi:hypothetical protein